MLAVGSLVGARSDDVVGVTADVAAGSEVVRAASLGTPTGVRELLSETTTTLVEATGSTTTTEAPAAPAPTATTDVVGTVPDEPGAPTTTAPPTARALTTDTRPEPEATTTTEAPRRAPPTTAAPTATTTTTAPPKQSSSSSGGYAYDDPRSTQVWYDLAQCESGGNWSIDTGNGYYGGLQFSLGSWEAVGGSGYPHEHPAATQIDFGRKLQASQGWGAWPHCSEKLGLR